LSETINFMKTTLLASGLGFPEGPVVMGEGRVVFCDCNTGELLVCAGDTVSAHARTGGSPWGAALGGDGAIYLTQAGNVPGSGDSSAVPGIQRVRADGTGEMLLELPGVYPNGIAFDARQRLYWTESRTRRVQRLDGGKPVTFCQLPDSHVPDGMAFAADGRLFVATTVSQGITVISADGAVLDEIHLGEHATNCVFDGSDLYVTATRAADIEAAQRTGTFWRVETDATGLELIPGRL
jgi:gluconolactonase